MSSAPCWIERMEVDPIYDYRSDSWDGDAPLWSPNCGHDVCLMEEALHDAGQCTEMDQIVVGVDCPQSVCRWNTAHAMCDLDSGHDGEHVFASPDEIVLVFPAPAPRGARP